MKVFSLFIFLFVLSSHSHAQKACYDIFAPSRVYQKQVDREQMIQDYSERVFRSKEQNERWIQVAMGQEGRPGLHVEITVSRLKELNDVIVQNKDLVTALVNLKKQIDIEVFQSLLSKEGVEIYSDYKTLRFFIPSSGKNIKNLSQQLEQAFNEANRRFEQEVSGLVRQNDLQDSWFQMGMAKSADLASYAARKAKDLDQRVLDLTTTQNQKRLQEDLNEVHQMYAKLSNFPSFRDTVLDSQVGGVSLRTVEIYRKNKTARKLSKALEEAYGYEVSWSSAKQLIQFFEKVDLLSPSLIIAERTSVGIESAPNGAFSLDFIGLGAKNLLATMEAALSTRSSQEVMGRIRENERKVTREFDQQKRSVREQVYTFFQKQITTRLENDPMVKFSGDEGAIIAPRFIHLGDLVQLQKQMLDLFGVAQLRMTFMPSNKKQQIETDIVSLSEAIEKALKVEIGRDIHPDLLSQTQFNIFASGKRGNGQRTIELVLYSKESHSPRQRERIRQAFKDVVIKMNHDNPELGIEPGHHVSGWIEG